jgi:hypothetical protein
MARSWRAEARDRVGDKVMDDGTLAAAHASVVELKIVVTAINICHECLET